MTSESEKLLIINGFLMLLGLAFFLAWPILGLFGLGPTWPFGIVGLALIWWGAG